MVFCGIGLIAVYNLIDNIILRNKIEDRDYKKH
jgi:hypothetical protein